MANKACPERAPTEIAARMDAALRRSLSTPPSPRDAKKKARPSQKGRAPRSKDRS